MASTSANKAAKTYKISNIENELFNNSTPEIRKVIVEIGCGIYNNLECITSVSSKDSEQQIQERLDTLLSNKCKTIEYLNQELAEHNAKKECELHALNLRIDELKKDSEQQIQERLDTLLSNKCKTIEYLNQELAEHNTKKECELHVLNGRIDELKDDLHACRGVFETNKTLELLRYETAYSETIKSLREQICGLEHLRDVQYEQIKSLDKSKNLKTVEMGIEGEQSVMDYIGQTFSEGVLQDTTKKGGHGDIHFQYKDVNILIEVKNKDNITLEDLNKFKRDILETKCEGGVFVSVKTGVNIPCHSNYDVEWLNNVPILYITNFTACPSTLYTSIKTIHFYVTNVSESISETEECKKKTEEFDALMDIVRCFSCSLEDLVMDTKRMTERLNKLQNVIKDKVDFQLEREHMSYTDNVMIMFRSYEISHNELPNEDFLLNHGIARSVIKELGGIKELKKQYNARRS